MILDTKKDLSKIRILEEQQKLKNRREDTFLPAIHIMPPVGWLNDPNGLCQLDGMHHIYFQYSPHDAKGGDKYWGHYETRDFLHYKYTGVFLLPDSNADSDGVYSGSAYVFDGTIHFYYTGNVKEEGDYDYIYEGRGSNTILVTSKDGIEPSTKQVLLTNSVYPDRLSCHIRDPKVWKEKEKYEMVLGARTKDDKGCVLLYESRDAINWSFVKYIETRDKFGYMWECPDLFELDENFVLSFSPQGLKTSEFCYQNSYQSGYFLCDNKINIVSNSFVEWDMGFDFYAPQTYVDESGRRILIGWMGVPDACYDHDPSIEKGWQHMLTIPRELTWDASTGRIRQWPIDELLKLRKETPICVETLTNNNVTYDTLPEFYEFTVENIKTCTELSVFFDQNLKLTYDDTIKVLDLIYLDCGYGRDIRRIKLNETLTDLRVYVDRSSVEIFINKGNYTSTSKYFYKKPQSTDQNSTQRKLSIQGCSSKITIYELMPMEFEI